MGKRGPWGGLPSQKLHPPQIVTLISFLRQKANPGLAVGRHPRIGRSNVALVVDSWVANHDGSLIPSRVIAASTFRVPSLRKIQRCDTRNKGTIYVGSITKRLMKSIDCPALLNVNDHAGMVV